MLIGDFPLRSISSISSLIFSSSTLHTSLLLLMSSEDPYAPPPSIYYMISSSPRPSAIFSEINRSISFSISGSWAPVSCSKR